MKIIELFTLFAKIAFDDSEFTSGVNKAQSGFSKLGSVAGTIGSGVVTATKAMTAGIAAAGTAVTAVVASSVKAYADYEQLVGGVETLFKSSSDTVMAYAENAFMTAGLSSNDYMETITSFSASLLQSLGGDTEAAAQVGDMAISDMADNANKMGSSMESIQNAYQGFAKQNYTMLDNLKLGYGGTKSEMERLLADAEKISGIKYDISSLSDVYNAIHVVQEELDITGTTALEAATTIQGSAASMKAAWENMLVGIADESQDFDSLILNLIGSVGTFADNLLPRIEVALGGVAKLIEGLFPKIAAELPTLVSNILPSLVNSAVSIVDALVTGISDNMDKVMEASTNILDALINGLSQTLPQLTTIAVEIVSGLALTLLDNTPQILQAGIDVILALVDGLSQSLPQLIPAAVDAVTTITTSLLDNADQLIESSIQLITSLADGLITSLPIIIEKIPEVILKIVDALITNAPLLVTAAIEIIVALTTGILQNLPLVVEAATSIVVGLVNTFKETDWLQIGKDILNGVIEGIKSLVGSAVETVKGVASSIADGFKSFFGIASPSKLMSEYGGYIVEGLNEGMESKEGDATSIAADISGSVQDGLSTVAPESNDIGKWLTDIQSTANTGVPKIIDGIVKLFAELPQKVNEAITPTNETINEWAVATISGGETGANEFVDTVYRIMSETPNKVYDAIKPGIERVENWVSQLIATANSRLPAFITSVTGVLAKLPPEFEKIGSQSIESLWSGMESRTDWFMGNLQSFISEVSQTMADGLASALDSPGSSGSGGGFSPYSAPVAAGADGGLTIVQHIHSVTNTPYENELAARAAFDRLRW